MLVCMSFMNVDCGMHYDVFDCVPSFHHFSHPSFVMYDDGLLSKLTTNFTD